MSNAMAKGGCKGGRISNKIICCVSFDEIRPKPNTNTRACGVVGVRFLRYDRSQAAMFCSAVFDCFA